MLRVSSLTVNTLAVFGKRSVVSCISDNLNTPLSSGQRFLDFARNDKWKRAANASRQLGEREKLGSLLAEIGGQLHSGCKLTTEVAESAEFYFGSAVSPDSAVHRPFLTFSPRCGDDRALMKIGWEPIADAIEARTGITADAFALSAYDAFFVVQLSLVHANPQKNFDNFKAAFIDEAGHYQGVTGSTALDPAGDRLNGDFDFWAVRPQNGSYGWVRIGSYNNGMLTLF